VHLILSPSRVCPRVWQMRGGRSPREVPSETEYVIISRVLHQRKWPCVPSCDINRSSAIQFLLILNISPIFPGHKCPRNRRFSPRRVPSVVIHSSLITADQILRRRPIHCIPGKLRTSRIPPMSVFQQRCSDALVTSIITYIHQ
jgi:hypothetical protein